MAPSTRKFSGFQAFLVLVAAWIWKYGWVAHSSVIQKPPLPHSYFAGGNANSSCQRVHDDTKSMGFCEDMTEWIDSGREKLLVSCDPGRYRWNTVMGPLIDPNPRGGIWIYDISTDKAKPLSLKDFPTTSDFHPLGIHVLPATESYPAYLFAINHGRHRPTVEQFEISKDLDSGAERLKYVRTWQHSSIHAPNGLVVLSPTSFYVGNDHIFTARLPSLLGKILPLIETVGVIPLGWVSLVTLDTITGEVTAKRAIRSAPFPNGIALSPDGKEFALASSNTAEVQLYTRDPATNELTYKEKIYLPFSPDNLSYKHASDDNNSSPSLLAAGHPFFPQLIKYAAQKSKHSSSWAVDISRVPPGSKNEGLDNGTGDEGKDKGLYSSYWRAPKVESHALKTVYQSDGSHFSASTTAIEMGGKLFVAGLYENGILECTY